MALLPSSALNHGGIWWTGVWLPLQAAIPGSLVSGFLSLDLAKGRRRWETGGGREEKIGIYLPLSEQISRSHMSSVLQLSRGDPSLRTLVSPPPSSVPPASLCCGYLLGASPTLWASQLAPP